MQSTFDFILWFIILPIPLIAIVVYYLALPLLIRTQQKFPAAPALLEVHFDRLRPSLAKFLTTTTNDLYELGFGEATVVKIPDPAPQVRTFLVMLVNRAAGDKAMVTAILGTGPVPMQNLYLEFSTSFESGEVFDTLNSTELNAFPAEPRTIRTQVPAVIDPEELYELHRFVMKKHALRAPKVVYKQGQGLDYLLHDVLVKSYERQVKRGWLFYDEHNDCYRPTLKGAYLITWGLLQPMKAFRVHAMQKHAREILKEFDQARDS